nr:SCP2 sterol-binding domain-containing protein [Pseudaestuariivita rosea]
MNEKLSPGDLDQSVKFVIEDEGSFVMDGDGARAGDEPTDLTVITDTETLQGLQDGSVNATTAYMTGKLKIEGDMALAMKLGSILA